MQTLLVVASRSTHGNTLRVADALAEVLGARIVTPSEVDPAALREADLVGLGSGIYHQRVDRSLSRLVREIPDGRGQRAFVFCTSGLPPLPLVGGAQRFARRLRRAGYDVQGRFECLATDTWGPFGLVGGVNRGRPDERDLDAARAFARGFLAPRPE